ncbi:MAG: hypothetical protein ACETWQ_21045 [Phycisphaerae bacterium]
MNPTDQIERAIERLHITTRAETDERILDDAFAALEKSTQKQSPHVGRSAQQRALRIRIAEIAAVAAVILVAFALFFGTQAKKAITLSEIYEALGRVENVCVAAFQPPANEPLQTEWVSQTLNIDMVRIGEQFVLWDITNKIRMIKYLSSASVRTEVVSEEMLAKAEKAIHQTFGLLPFAYYKEAPQDAQWSRVDDTQVAAVVPDTKVYELIWQEKSTTSDAIGLKKWRIFVDARSNLPKRAEHYFKLKPQEEYKFETYEVITYPSDDEIQADIRKIFGPAAGRPDEPGYIGTPGDRPR